MTTSFEPDSKKWQRPSSLREMLDFLEAGRRVQQLRRARADLPQFARHVFSIEPAQHHLLMLDALGAVYDGDIPKLLIIAPPGHAKSTYASIVFPSFYIGHRYNETVIGVTTTDTLGKLYGNTIRTVVEESPEWKSTFRGVEPDHRRGWSADGFFLKGPEKRKREQKDPTVVFTGGGGPVIGRRADGVIIDDAVDEETARSETLMEARKLWIRRSVFSRLKPGGWRIIAGTLWADGDVVDTAEQSGDYVTIRMQARSTSNVQEADVSIPDGVTWRPRLHRYREVEHG